MPVTMYLIHDVCAGDPMRDTTYRAKKDDQDSANHTGPKAFGPYKSMVMLTGRQSLTEVTLYRAATRVWAEHTDRARTAPNACGLSPLARSGVSAW